MWPTVQDSKGILRSIFQCMLWMLAIGHGLMAVGVDKPEKLTFDFPHDFQLLSSGNQIISSGRGTLNYGPWKMEADSITFDRTTQRAQLFGNVIVRGEGMTLSTMFVDYNVKSKTGLTGSLTGMYEPPLDKTTVASGNATEESNQNDLEIDDVYSTPYKSDFLAGDALKRKAYFSAHHADIHPNSKGLPELVLRSVVVSDCDHEPPHHDVAVGKLRWSKGKTVEAQHVRPRIVGVPYFYLPWAGRDMSRDWPWTRYTVGSKSSWGRFGIFETKIFPEETDDHLKLIVGGREKRGSSLGLEWDKATADHRQKLHLNSYQERFDDKGVVIKDDRWRVDWLERIKLDSEWDLSLDAYSLSPRKMGIWNSSNAQILSQNLYLNPFGSNIQALQRREGLIEDYDQEQWERGRLLENELALDYHNNNGGAMRLSSLQPADGEQLRSRFKNGDLRLRQSPNELGAGLLWSGEMGMTHQGQRMGWQLNDADLHSLGNVKREEFETWRVDQLLRVEQIHHAGPVTVKPYVGNRLIGYGDVLKDSAKNLEYFEFDEQRDLDGSTMAPRLLSGIEFDSLASSQYADGAIGHQVRPSLQFRFAGPSSLQQEQVVAEVDGIDLEERPRFELLWGLQNDVLKGQGDKRRLFYNQGVTVSQLFRDADRDEIHGEDHREGSDIRFQHSVYPSRSLNVYNEVRVNSFQAQAPWVRAGTRWKPANVELNYSYTRLKDLRDPNEIANRHDVFWRYVAEKDDYKFNVSWDAEQRASTIKSDDFYEKGFRRFDLMWGHRFHCMRTELAFEYDFEDSGATLIFRFGPDLFRGALPQYREGTQGL